MERAARDCLSTDVIGQDVLRFDACRVDGERVGARHQQVAREFSDRAAGAVRDRRIEAVVHAARADLAQPRAVAEDLVADDHQEAVLRQIEREPFAGAVANAERAVHPRRLIEARRRQPAILDRGQRALRGETCAPARESQVASRQSQDSHTSHVTRQSHVTRDTACD